MHCVVLSGFVKQECHWPACFLICWTQALELCLHKFAKLNVFQLLGLSFYHTYIQEKGSMGIFRKAVMGKS